MFYRQCILQRGTTTQITWIPEQFAKRGKFLRLNEQNGWRVEEVSGIRKSETFLDDHERDYLGQRKVSDI